MKYILYSRLQDLIDDHYERTEETESFAIMDRAGKAGITLRDLFPTCRQITLMWY